MQRETWFTWRELVRVEGEAAPRLLVPRSDPREFERPFDLLFETTGAAVSALDEFMHDPAEECEGWVLCCQTLEPVGRLEGGSYKPAPPPPGQGHRPKGCPHCLSTDISACGGAFIERGEFDGKSYETEGQAGAYQCAGCGAEFYVWDDAAGDGAGSGRTALLQDILHQLETDSDLDTVTGAEKYRGLAQRVREVLGPDAPPVIKTVTLSRPVSVHTDAITARHRGRLAPADIRRVIAGEDVACPDCGHGHLTTDQNGGARLVTCPTCPFWCDASEGFLVALHRHGAAVDTLQARDVLIGLYVTCPKCGTGDLDANNVGGVVYVEHQAAAGCDFVQEIGPAESVAPAGGGAS